MWAVAISAHGELFWLLPSGIKMLPWLFMPRLSSGTGGMTEDVEMMWGPNVRVKHRLGPTQFSWEIKQRVHQKEGDECFFLVLRVMAGL